MKIVKNVLAFLVVLLFGTTTGYAGESKKTAINNILLGLKDTNHNAVANYCVIVSCYDRSFVGRGSQSFDFIATVSDGKPNNTIIVKYIKLHDSGMESKKLNAIIERIAKGERFDRVGKTRSFNMYAPDTWGKRRLVESLQQSEWIRLGKQRKVTGFGDMYYIGFSYGECQVITSDLEQNENIWSSVRIFADTISDAIQKHSER